MRYCQEQSHCIGHSRKQPNIGKSLGRRPAGPCTPTPAQIFNGAQLDYWLTEAVDTLMVGAIRAADRRERGLYGAVCRQSSPRARLNLGTAARRNETGDR